MKKLFIGCIVGLLIGCTSVGAKVSFDGLKNINAPFIVDVIGDNRGRDKEYTALINLMAKDSPVASFNVGDLTAIPCIGVKEFQDRSLALKSPYFFAPGNHDIIGNGDCYLKWSKQPGLYFSFDINKFTFIVLNSENLDETQLSWLKIELTKTKNKKFIFIHKPLYANKVHEALPDNLKLTLHKLFKDNNVAIVFQGHDHLYNKVIVDDISYIVTGGGGAPLYADGFYHYIRLSFKDTNILVEVISIDGKIIESWVVNKPNNRSVRRIWGNNNNARPIRKD